MAFYPTEGIKGPNGNYINCYLIETCLFLLFKIDGYICPQIAGGDKKILTQSSEHNFLS